MRAWDLHDNCMTYTKPSKMPLRTQDLLEHLTNYQLSTTYYYTVTFMLQPSKMQGEARNHKKGILARFTRNCANCAHRISLKI